MTAISTIKNNWSKIKPLTMDVLVLALIALFVRLPYFFDTVIHWHESTYILEGQDLLNGHLPQTVISELKPPFAALPYALFIALFGKSIIAVRLGGMLCIFAASLAIYLACRKHIGRAGAVAAGIAVAVFATIESQSGCTMIEHIAIVPLSLLVLIWTPGRLSLPHAFIIGLLIGLAGALKTNLVLFILGPLALVLANFKRQTIQETISQCLVLILGVVLPKILLVPIYLLYGAFDLLWQSTVIAPTVAVAHHRDEFLSKLPIMVDQLKAINIPAFLFAWVAPCVGLSIALRDGKNDQKKFILAIAVFLAAGFLTIFAAWTLHARRYYIVLVPFTAALSSLFFQQLLSTRKRILVTAAIALLALQPLYTQYARAWNTLTQAHSTDIEYNVVEYLRQKNIANEYVYFHAVHIGYWLTGCRIPTRFVHPTDIEKDYLLKSLYTKPTSPIEELKSIFKKQPLYVITHNRSAEQSSKESPFVQALDKQLNSDYILEKTVDGIGIFRRKI